MQLMPAYHLLPIPAKESSPFIVGDTGVIRGRPFTIIGHLHFHEQGADPLDDYWEEWVLLFEDNTIGYLESESGKFFISTQKKTISIKRTLLDQWQVGTTLEIDGIELTAQEKGKFIVYTIDGQFLYRSLPGKHMGYIDATFHNYVASIEYGQYNTGQGNSEQLINLFYGVSVDSNDLSNNRFPNL